MSYLEKAFWNGDISKRGQLFFEAEDKRPYDPEIDGPFPDDPETRTENEN